MRIVPATLTPEELKGFNFLTFSDQEFANVLSELNQTVLFAQRGPGNQLVIFNPKDESQHSQVCLVTETGAIVADKRPRNMAIDALFDKSNRGIVVATHPNESKLEQLWRECESKAVRAKIGDMLTKPTATELTKPFDPFNL